VIGPAWEDFPWLGVPASERLDHWEAVRGPALLRVGTKRVGRKAARKSAALARAHGAVGGWCQWAWHPACQDHRPRSRPASSVQSLGRQPQAEVAWRPGAENRPSGASLRERGLPQEAVSTAALERAYQIRRPGRQVREAALPERSPSVHRSGTGH
jgi:hypothetical protein